MNFLCMASFLFVVVLVGGGEEATLFHLSYF